MTAAQPTETPTLAARSGPYLDYLERWLRQLPTVALADIVADAGGPERVAIAAVDLTVGFCHQGALSSPRVAALLPTVARLLTHAHALGMDAIVLPQDTHAPDAQEFASFPQHCVRGTEESRTAPELLALPFADIFTVIEKNSISSTIGTEFERWEAERGPFAAYIVVGDCTDICVFQLALALKLRGNAGALGTRVIVPANAVDTFDIPVDAAARLGARPHPGDLYHHLFLHAMATNGVEIVASIA